MGRFAGRRPARHLAAGIPIAAVALTSGAAHFTAAHSGARAMGPGDADAGPAARAPAPLVRVGTTGNDSELVETLPITRRRGAHQRVVMSLGPPELPDLAAGDRLRVTAEMQVTGNCASRGPRCRGRPYHYAPVVRARLVIAADARTTGGRRSRAISGVARETCTQRRPQYEHHCVLVFTRADTTIRPGSLPCALDDCHVNLVADAHHPRARSGERIMVGGLKPNGAIPQDRGRINAVRYRDSQPADFPAATTTRLERRRLRPDFKRRVVISKRLPFLRAGEQLAVSAAMLTDVSRLRYAVRTSARLVLARSPNATRPDEFVKRRALGHGELSENNGSNCTKHEGICTARKVGVLEMRADSTDASGRAVPLYLNLVTVMGPKVRRARPRDRVVVREGRIDVTRFPPSVR